MPATFSSLRNVNYRWFAAGSLIANTATWMQRITQDWLVLQVTNSGLDVGITTALQFLPSLIFGPISGLLADRRDKRIMMVLSGVMVSIASLALGVLSHLGTVHIWEIYVFAFVLGTGAAFDGPVRQTYVREMVGRDLLTNAIGLSGASFHTARILGPALAGLLIGGGGVSFAFYAIGIGYLLNLTTLTRIDASKLIKLPRSERGDATFGAAVRHVRSQPALIVIMVLAGAVCAFSLNFQVTITLMATKVFGLGAGEFGILSSVMAVGSITGALLAARRGWPTFKLVIGACGALGVLYLLAGFSPTYLLFGVALVPIGLTSNTFMTSANAAVQVRIAPQYQGRGMALYILVTNVGTPLGAPFIGFVAQSVGTRWSLFVSGALALGGAVVAGLCLLRLRAFADDRPQRVAEDVTPAAPSEAPAPPPAVPAARTELGAALEAETAG